VSRYGIELGRLRLPVSATSPGAARELIAIVVRQWELPEEVGFAARLAVSELVTNTLMHCPGMPGGTVLVIVSRTGPMLRVKVHDGSDESPRIRHPGDTEETGRGLTLVAQVATECGHYPTPFGKAVWFDLATPWPLDHAPQSSPS
jgi:anti-sigma regulatory factor (Ser/Thr protein kinase)